MDEDAEFTLESILAEYGSGTPAEPEPGKKKEPRAAGGKETRRQRSYPPAEKGGDGEKNGG